MGLCERCSNHLEVSSGDVVCIPRLTDEPEEVKWRTGLSSIWSRAVR